MVQVGSHYAILVLLRQSEHIVYVGYTLVVLRYGSRLFR